MLVIGLLLIPKKCRNYGSALLTQRWALSWANRFINRGMHMHHCMCNKSITGYPRINLTETKSSVHCQILWNVFWVCVFRCAAWMGTKSVIHFPVLTLYSGLTQKGWAWFYTHNILRKITCSTRLMNMSTLFFIIFRNCEATIYGHTVLIKTLSHLYRRNPKELHCFSRGNPSVLCEISGFKGH